MLKKLKGLWEDKQQRNELILYVVMGLLTTIVNYGVYYVATRLLGIDKAVETWLEDMGNAFAHQLLKWEFGLVVPNVIAWVIAVLFAFFTNRKWVFKSQKHGAKAILLELAYFTGGRLASLIIFDVALFALLANIMQANDLIIKLITNIGVVIFNYFVGKFFVFKKEK